MNILLISAVDILFCGVLFILLYAYAISLLIRKNAGIVLYLVLFLFPVAGALGIVTENLRNRQKRNR